MMFENLKENSSEVFFYKGLKVSQCIVFRVPKECPMLPCKTLFLDHNICI